ncbi:MAG: ATPase P, partial [Bacteroidetes bacterium]|nr:ATPase P [Bacteroidota bacterium]
MSTRELSVEGMDCAGCARSVQTALERVPGVRGADVRLMAEKAVVDIDDGATPGPEALRQAVEAAGYRVRDTGAPNASGGGGDGWAVQAHRNLSLGLLGAIVASVLAIALVGHGLGVFAWLQAQVPWWIGVAGTLLLGYPVFKQVVQAARQASVTAHTLMTVGVVAALLAGEWVTA